MGKVHGRVIIDMVMVVTCIQGRLCEKSVEELKIIVERFVARTCSFV